MNTIHSLHTGYAPRHAPPYVPRRIPRLLLTLLLALLVACALSMVSVPTAALAQGFEPGPLAGEPATDVQAVPEPAAVESASGIGLFVVGGAPADLGEYPWQVVLRRDGSFVCGGSLIHPRWVLTAAHCVTKVVDSAGSLFYYPARRFEIVAGELTRSAPDFVEQPRDVVQVLVHPGYRTNTPGTTLQDNDLALLKLRTPVEVTEFVQPIRVASGEVAEQLTSAGVVAHLTGWGTTVSGDMTSASNVLQEVEVPIAAQDACAATMGALAPVTPGMLCVGYPEGGAGGCQGDSGGPLAVRDGDGGWWQVGVVSWGSSFCSSDPYGYTVLARVPTFLDWIQSIVLVSDGTPPLANGGFSAGSDGWVTSSTKGLTLVGSEPDSSGLDTVDMMGMLGGATNETSRLRQLVYLSDRTQSLHFDYRAYSDETECGADKAIVRHGSATLGSMELCRDKVLNGWQHAELDISLQAGNVAWLEFVVVTDRDEESSLLIDNVYVESTPLEPLAVAAFGPAAAVTGAPVAVEGTDLGNVVDVRFGDVPARFTVEGENSLTAWVPAGAADAPLTVHTAYAAATSADSFSPRTQLTVLTAGDGAGTVASVEPGVRCGYDCSEEYARGVHVRLVAMAGPGAIFTGWSGACAGLGDCVLLLSEDRTVTAGFAPQQVPVILSYGVTEVGRAMRFDAALPMSVVDTCMWTFGDGHSSSCEPAASAAVMEPDAPQLGHGLVPAAYYSLGEHMYSQTGEYVVTITATNAAGVYAAAVKVKINEAGTPTPSVVAPDVSLAAAKVFFPTVLR